MEMYEPIPRSLAAAAALLDDPRALIVLDRSALSVVVDKKRSVVCIQYEDGLPLEVPLRALRIFLPHMPAEHPIVDSALAFALAPLVHVGGTGSTP